MRSLVSASWHVPLLSLFVLVGVVGAGYQSGVPHAPRLTAVDSFEVVPSSQYLALLPDGETKRRFILDCTGCHQFDPWMIGADGRLKSAAEWEAHTARMLSFAGAQTGFPIIAPSRDAAATAAWLTRHLGDDKDPLPSPAPLVFSPDPSVQMTAFAYPLRQDIPHDLTLDDRGHVVITGQLSGRMITLDPDTGMFTEHQIPIGRANPRAVEVDEGGDWWVLLGGPEKIARYRPPTEAWDTWDIGMHPHSIVRDGQGRVWFNGHFSKEPEQIGMLDPATGAVTTFDVPSPPMPDGGSTIPYGLRLSPDGTLWGTQLLGSRLVKFEPTTETFTLYDLPTAYSGPRRPDVGPDGIVWIPEYAASKLARFDPATETFREFELPIPDALPYVVRVDAERGWVWIATAGADALIRFFPDEERFTIHPLPPRSLVRHLHLAEAAGTLWLATGNFPAVDPQIIRVEVEGG